MNTKRKAGIMLIAIILGLVISPAVAIEDSAFAKNLANFEASDTFYQRATPMLPSQGQPLGQ